MAPYIAAALTANLHGDTVDIQFLALRTSYRKLYILVWRVVFSSHPCSAFTGTYQQAVSSGVAILHHTFHLCRSSSSITIYDSIVVSRQSPGSSEWVSPTQLDSIHRNAGSCLLLAHCGSNSTFELASSSGSNLSIEGLDDRSTLIAYLKGICPVLLVSRKLYAFRSRDSNSTSSRIESQATKCQFFSTSLTYIHITHISIGRSNREVGRNFDIISQDTLFLHQLCTEACSGQGACQVIVRIVCLSTFVKECCIAFVIASVTLVEVLGSCRHIDECDIFSCCKLLHLVAVVHSMVVSSNLQSGLQSTINDGIVFVAQIVAANAGNRSCSISEIAAANSRHQNRGCTLLLYGIDNLFQALLIGCRRSSSASVALDGSSIGCITLSSIVSLQFQVVNTIVLSVVVGKLDEHIVTSLNIVLGILPQLVEAAARVASALGVVNTGPPIGEEITEVHSPAARIGGRFIIRCHRGVTQRVHLLCSLNATDGKHQA